MIPLVAQDLRATRVAFSYIRDALVGSSLLKSMVADVLTLEIVLTNRTTILCFPCTLRSLRAGASGRGARRAGVLSPRGPGRLGCEIQAAIRRGMLAFRHPPGEDQHPVHEERRALRGLPAGFGHDNPDLLVWRASSQLMNPTILRAAWRKSAGRTRAASAASTRPSSARIWTPSCRRVGRGAVISGAPGCRRSPGPVRTSPRRSERGRERCVHGGHRPRGGAPHRPGRHAGLVGLPVAPARARAVTAEIADLCRRYGVSHVVGDRYGAEWVRQAFRDARLGYWAAPWTKAEAYRELEPSSWPGS